MIIGISVVIPLFTTKNIGTLKRTYNDKISIEIIRLIVWMHIRSTATRFETKITIVDHTFLTYFTDF